MDLATILTILGSFLATCGIMISLFIHLYSKIDTIQAAIHLEMKDFHGRLCAIEERRGK